MILVPQAHQLDRPLENQEPIYNWIGSWSNGAPRGGVNRRVWIGRDGNMRTGEYALGLIRSPGWMLFGLVMLTGCLPFSPGGVAPLETVERVEIERYMGRWYEIAKYPNTFEQGCFGVTADYTLNPDGTVRVVNLCRSEDGTEVVRSIEGFAKVADRETNAKLIVYFFYPFGAPYWIIDLDTEYQYAVVGEPSRNFLWILSRTPTLEPAVYDAILSRIQESGYDPSRLVMMKQFDAP